MLSKDTSSGTRSRPCVSCSASLASSSMKESLQSRRERSLVVYSQVAVRLTTSTSPRVSQLGQLLVLERKGSMEASVAKILQS